MENFTRENGLIQEISETGWLANPAGRQGYEVILLERIGNGGTRFYCSLKPGETLRFSERLFGNFQILAVDMRHARAFSVCGQFSTVERGRKVTLQANVRYHVVNAQILAMETLDPLGELRDKVTSSLVREIAGLPEERITPQVIERIIRSVKEQVHLGLTVEDAEVTQFTSDSRITTHIVQEEDLRHQLNIDVTRQNAELQAQARKHSAEIASKQELHENIRLTDLNVLMHEYPNLIPGILATLSERQKSLLQARMDVVGPAIQAYIEQQREIDKDINPLQIAAMMREAIETPGVSDRGAPQITWGDEFKGLPENSYDDKGEPPLKSEPGDVSGLIKFGDVSD